MTVLFLYLAALGILGGLVLEILTKSHRHHLVQLLATMLLIIGASFLLLCITSMIIPLFS
jgi:hypothetical protein